MGLSEILCIVIIIMLLVVIVLQITGHKKSDIIEITSLLKHTADEQRSSVQKQIADGATEQFERFGIIQKSIQETLSGNRDEVNRQLGIFQLQMDTKLTAIQKAGTESNEQIGGLVTIALQNSRKEQNNQLHAFGEQVDSRLSSIQRANTENIDRINTTLENKMKELQESNEKKT